MLKLDQSEEIEPKVVRQETVLRDLFRILTPDEIDFLCQMTDGMPKVPLTTLIEKELKNKLVLEKRTSLASKVDHKAKILPFRNLSEVSAAISSGQPENKDLQNAEQTSISHIDVPHVPEKKLEGAELVFQKEQIIIEKKIDRIKFILEQREKFRKHYINLKKVEIYELYTKESDISIGNQERSEEGTPLNFNTENKGILINKKCS